MNNSFIQLVGITSTILFVVAHVVLWAAYFRGLVSTHKWRQVGIRTTVVFGCITFSCLALLGN